MRFKVGEQPVPGYRLDAFLGAGSYGEVWKVIGPGGVPCAMKFISLDSKSGLKEFRSIGLVKKLQHPNLCPVNAIWLRDDEGNVLSDTDQNSMTIRLLGPKELIIAMGLGRKTLGQRLEETRGRGIPPHELLRYMVDAAKGIDYLNSPEHELGGEPSAVIHCDIKPANLLIVGGGVQVCDYGVIRALGPDVVRKTFAAGTPAYAPPELINNEPCAQTDQYSLAITYYELRTGQLPFDETKAIVANLTGQLDLSLVAGNDEREVLKQALSLQPDRRFGSCEEFVDTLRVASGITLGRPPSGVHQFPTSRSASGGSPESGQLLPLPQPGTDRSSWPQSTPFADRPTPRVTPTPLPPDSAEHRPLPQSPPPPPPRRAATPHDGTLQLDAPGDVVVNLVSGPTATPRRTPTPEPPLPKGTGVFIDDEERQPLRTGAFLPLAIGLILFLGLMATGVYIFFIKPGTDTNPTTAPTETKPTDPVTPVTKKDPIEPKPTPKNNGGGTQDPPKDYSKELRQARAHFALALGDDQELPKGLAELAKIPNTEPTANKLRTWWTAVQSILNEAGTGPMKFAKHVPMPTTELLDVADVASAKAYRSPKLAKVIETSIPDLDIGVSWEDLAKLCDEATDTAVVRACRAECWAEIPLKDKTYTAEAVPEALTGYPKYVAARLKYALGAKAADVAPELAEVFEKVPTWTNTHRTRNTYDILFAAAQGASNDDAYRWLTIVNRDAATLKIADDMRFDIRQRLLKAGWADGAMKDANRGELKKLAQSLKADAKRLEKLSPTERYKFWVAFASTLLDAMDGEERDRAFIEALNVAKDVKATELRKHILDPILTDAFARQLPKGSATPLYRLAGHSVRRNRVEWEKEKDAPDAMAYAAGLYNRAVGLTNSPEDLAWKGICLAESKTPSAKAIAEIAKALEGPKRTDPLVVKLFRGVAGHLQASNTPTEQSTKLEAHKHFVAVFDALAKTKDATDERPVLMRWATTNAWWLANTGFPEQPKSLDFPKPSENPAPEAETYYVLATVERFRAATTREVVEECSTRAIELYKKAWGAAAQPGAERWAKPAASGYGDLLIAEGERQWNIGDTDAATTHFGGLVDLIKPASPVSPTRKAWYEAHSYFRSARPQYQRLDERIEPRLANAPDADRDAVVHLCLLRAQALTVGTPGIIYPAALAGNDNRAVRSGLAVTAALKAVETATGLSPNVVVAARGALGMAYFFDGLAKKAEDRKGSLEQFDKARTAVAEAIQTAPQHENAYIWKFGFGFCVFEKVDAEKDYKNAGQLGLGYSLMLDAKADLFGAKPGTDRAVAISTVETSLKNWFEYVDLLPEDAGKDLVKLRELLDRAGAAATSKKVFTPTDADKELLERIAKAAKKPGTPAAMSKALERIGERLKPNE